MDPLSMIRQFAPGIEKLPMPKGGQDATAGQPIPATELQKLGPSSAATSAISAASTQSLAGIGGGGDSFSNLLGNLVQDVNSKQQASAQAVNGLMTGQNVSLHQAMISMEEANVSFQLMVEVRNKLLDSYQELMRMQM